MSTPLRSAIVTGAGSGIGRACAQALVADGWQVAFVGRRRDALEESIAASAAPAHGVAVPTDVGDPASVAALFDTVKARFGRLDLLFNNAGVSSHERAARGSCRSTWRPRGDTNLTGAFLCTQQAFRMMKAQQPMGGRIINNGSISAMRRGPTRWPTPPPSTPSPAHQAASLDGRAYNIAVGQIDIGNVASAT
jgi:NAD(P)-dependent dehydrogenase (short-subunit alcohol dehydrogenase family)